MPEAPMDEYYAPPPTMYEVGRAGEIFAVPFKPESHSGENIRNAALGSGVAPANRRHEPAASCW